MRVLLPWASSEPVERIKGVSSPLVRSSCEQAATATPTSEIPSSTSVAMGVYPNMSSRPASESSSPSRKAVRVVGTPKSSTWNASCGGSGLALALREKSEPLELVVPDLGGGAGGSVFLRKRDGVMRRARRSRRRTRGNAIWTPPPPRAFERLGSHRAQLGQRR